MNLFHLERVKHILTPKPLSNSSRLNSMNKIEKRAKKSEKEKMDNKYVAQEN